MKKKRIFSFMLVIISICIADFITNSLIRPFYQPAYRLNLDKVKGNIKRNIPYTPKNNKMGYRESEVTPELLEDDFRRFVFLGDSFTFGSCIVNGEDRFSDIIEKRLNMEAGGTGLKYFVYNAGRRGSKPKDWIWSLMELTQVAKPQYVFAIFFLNAGTSLSTNLVFHKHNIKNLKSKYENKFWYKYTYIGKCLADKLVELQFSDYYQKLIINAYLGTETEKGPWFEQQKHLLKIRNTCKVRGIEFHLIIFPMLFDLESEYKFYEVEEEISRFAQENGIPVFSLINGFLGQKSRSLWISAINQHPNEKGQLIAANTLYPYIKKALKH